MLSGDSLDIESIFDAVVMIEDSESQQLLLARLCGENLEVRRRVEELLRAYKKGEYLEAPFTAVQSTDPSISSLLGQWVDHYRVLEFLGEGGMGDVFLARDCEPPKSLVAIKVIKAGMDSRQVLARFELEKAVLRNLNHSSITRYIDSGYLTNGRAYFSMELVRGLPITEYCDQCKLGIDQRLELFREACSAVDYAHQNGIIHRDLKPNNIMVAQEDGNPIVKIIDFGIAKAMAIDGYSDSRFTSPVQFLGTPAYMSPEQFGYSFDVDERTDVYSLGAVLFELLVGSVPRRFMGSEDSSWKEGRSSILNDPPQTPSERISKSSYEDATLIAKQRGTTPENLKKRLRRDLDWIVLKALAKERTQRYDSVGSLASDLVASLEYRPTTAHAPTMGTSIRLWFNRHQQGLRSFAAAIAVIAAIFVAWWASRSADHTRRQLESSLEARDKRLSELAYNEFTSDLRQAAEALQNGSDRAAKQLLQRHSDSPFPSEYNHFGFRYLQGLMVKPVQLPLEHATDLLDMDVSPDERWMVTCDRGGDIVIIDLHSNQEVQRLHPADKEVTRVRFSPNGLFLASVGQDQKVRIWRTGSWESISVLAWHVLTINGLAWSPSGDRLATGDRGGNVCIWDVETREVIHRLPKHNGHVRCVAWSSDGKHIATADGDVGAILWSTVDWSQLAKFDSKKQGILTLEFSGDCRYLACGGYMNELILVNVDQAKELQRLNTDTFGGPWSFAFGNRNELLVGMGDGTLRLIEKSSATGEWEDTREIELSPTRSHFRRVKFLTTRSEILVGSEQTREVLRLPIDSVQGFRTLEVNCQIQGYLEELKVLIGRRRSDGASAVYDLESGALLQTLEMDVEANCRPVFSPTLGMVAVSGSDDQGQCVSLFEPKNWTRQKRIPSTGAVEHLSFSRDGTQLSLCCSKTNEAQDPTSIYELETESWRGLSEFFQGSKTIAEFSPDQDYLMLGMVAGRKLYCLDANTQREIASINLDSDLFCLCIPPQESFVLVGEANHLSCYTRDLKTLLWNSTTPTTILSVVTSPDGRIAACLHADGQVRLWDLQSQKMLYSLPYKSSENYEYRLQYWLSFVEPNRLLLGGIAHPDAIEFIAPVH